MDSKNRFLLVVFISLSLLLIVGIFFLWNNFSSVGKAVSLGTTLSSSGSWASASSPTPVRVTTLVISSCQNNSQCNVSSYCSNGRCVAIANSAQRNATLGYGEDAYYTATVGKEVCSDLKDNDGDSKVDCFDSDCLSKSVCNIMVVSSVVKIATVSGTAVAPSVTSTVKTTPTPTVSSTSTVATVSGTAVVRTATSLANVIIANTTVRPSTPTVDVAVKTPITSSLDTTVVKTQISTSLPEVTPTPSPSPLPPPNAGDSCILNSDCVNKGQDDFGLPFICSSYLCVSRISNDDNCNYLKYWCDSTNPNIFGPDCVQDIRSNLPAFYNKMGNDLQNINTFLWFLMNNYGSCQEIPG